MNRPAEALEAKELEDGRVAYVVPITFGRAYLTVAVERSDRLGMWDEAYTYETTTAAFAALAVWDGDGDPAGWIRHQPSNRRREHGDPALEEVRA